MADASSFQLGLLYLAHLLISSDGVIDEKERASLQQIKAKEKISDEQFNLFQKNITEKKERDIYQEGIELLNRCSDEDKLKAFVHLYKMSEADGHVHVKEVRLLLYSIKMTGIEFNDVVDRAKQTA
ncbi:MAG: TerB family tellurite resistance protein [Bacteroidota bacterium]